MSDREEVKLTLVDPDQVHNFRVGPTYVWTRRGVRRLTGWWAIEYKVRDFATRMTRWWRPRIVCSAVDRQHGRITLVMERWSWRRWRWERSE